MMFKTLIVLTALTSSGCVTRSPDYGDYLNALLLVAQMTGPEEFCFEQKNPTRIPIHYDLQGKYCIRAVQESLDD